MSQTPHPHDPFGIEPGTPAEQAAPASDPSLHPHDPFAYGSDASRVPSPPSAGEPAAQAPHLAAPAPAPAGHSAYRAQGGAPGGAPGGEQTDQPAPGTKGVYEGPLSGQPLNRSDSRMWGMFSQLAVVLGHVISWGFLGWVGPLIIFLMYKDRDRFVRFHATEALNGAIAVLIAQVALTIVITILTIFTLGVGSILYPLVGLPALLQLVFSIVGAVKANQGEYWAYPFNLRLVK
ncbi:DUF4870 domain-containing protein [Brachybacterium sp. AOP29-B2-41]|uniref:DUF4870 domain-containing protein n=1 Tax=Brachybacterium sp. AOP29-B2-41 TaxID=3457704 RepID=UPI004033F5FE